MIRQDYNRIDPRRRNVLDSRKKHFANATNKDLPYPHRLTFYTDAPTADITLEEFEQWAIDRLRVLAEIEACSFRNKSPQETATHMKPVLDKCLPLYANSTISAKPDLAADGLRDLARQRRKDHYSHFILRLAFASNEDLRRRFVRAETTLFKMRWASEDPGERQALVAGLSGMDWCESVGADERHALRENLEAILWADMKGKRVMPSIDEEAWIKVPWMRVPDLVEARKVFIKAGKAYVPAREQASMILAEFTQRLEKQLELTARALPRLDEDDRLTPILNHLSKNFTTPDTYISGSSTAVSGADISARNIDTLVQHFPACGSHMHRSLRRDAHLKYRGRLQYSLFLKGIGLSLDESLAFWRNSFHKITEDTFNKEYRYNVRHVYGDVGGDQNRRGGGLSPFGCQKILTENPPGTGEAHGCPYRHFNMENLEMLLQGMGVNDRSVVRGVREDKESLKFHLACNRVFEYLHKNEIKKAKDEGIMTAAQLETIVHPNEYFKRSYLLKSLGRNPADDADVKMEG